MSGPHGSNLLIRVKDHDGRLMLDEATEMQHEEVSLPQALLEDARRTQAGQFLLKLLSAVDYAGCGLDAKGRSVKRKPVMLLGWKHRSRTPVGGGKVRTHYVDGFTLIVSVPLRLKSKAPSLYTTNGAV